MVVCKICNKEYKNLFGLSKHISKIHNISSEEYYLQYIGNIVFCKTCNKPSKFKNLSLGYQPYCSSKCCNNNQEKKNNMSELRRRWWKESNNVEKTKNKIKKTISNYWDNKNSTYNSIKYKQKISNGQVVRWKKWRKENINSICEKYGFVPISKYKNSYSLQSFKCLKCNYIFESKWNYLQSGKCCPKCSRNNVSKQEIEVYEFLENIYSQKIIRNTYKIIFPYELDLYFPECNIAIEYNGLYTHSENYHWGGKPKNYHINKSLSCRKKNIRLIHIFEDEWIFKQEIVKERLRHILGLNNSEKIYARKCIIKEIDATTKNNFLEKFHLQGKDSSTIKLGAFYNDNLVSVMTFSKGNISKGSKSKEGVWELNRFCSDYNYQVIGIASKLLSYFKRNYHWKEIFSYADIRWSDGNLYEKLGFIFKYITEPNYWYIKNYQRIHRFNLRKRPNEPKELTEFQLRLEEGYNWIWDCGSYKFELTK